ncbi:MAG: helix-turn-helix transcriptional regulator [Gammaproteobacteria bacterium]|nr:helix-turn-helix transcriptional regulator [Gammaproteobacteria bacterium]
MKNIGKRILELRGKTSRRVFAEQLGIGTATLQRYEGGERLPDVDFAIKMQEITGCSLDYLIQGKSDNNHLSKDEMFLLQEFRNLTTEQKEIALQFFAGGLAGLQGKTVINSFNGTISNSFNGKE